MGGDEKDCAFFDDRIVHFLQAHSLGTELKAVLILLAELAVLVFHRV